jgi:hypothetical protein
VRQPALLLRLAVLVVSTVVGATVVIALSSRSDLSHARREVDAAWGELRPALDQRYQALAEATAAVRSRLGADRTLLAEIDRAVATWSAGQGAVEDQVRSAMRLEGLIARLTATVAATPRLRSSEDVGRALGALDGSNPGVARQRYNRAVGAYEDVRGAFPRRLVAGALGFEARRTLEVPA